MATLLDYKTEIEARFTSLSMTYSDNDELDQEQMNDISHQIDEANETVNPNLPVRPTS